MIANQDQPLVETTEMLVAPWAVDGDPPLEHRARNVHAPWNDPVKVAGILRADIDDGPVIYGGRKGVGSGEPGDLLRGLFDQTLERPPPRAAIDGRIRPLRARRLYQVEPARLAV